MTGNRRRDVTGCFPVGHELEAVWHVALLDRIHRFEHRHVHDRQHPAVHRRQQMLVTGDRIGPGVPVGDDVGPGECRQRGKQYQGGGS